jgi:hypothetical protein
MSSTLRLHQNLQLWGTLDFPLRRRFELMFRRWKSIGTVNPLHALAMIRCKLRHKAFLSFVYRSGRLALADWTSKLTPALTTERTKDVVQRIAFDGRLRIDYLQYLIKPGRVYSLPCVRNVVALEDACSTSSDDTLHALAESVLYFEGVDTNALAKATADRN